MTLISCGIVGGFITWIIFKNQLNKKIGGKKVEKNKSDKEDKKQIKYWFIFSLFKYPY
ncbi:hypothetical protein [Spiroplasma citri]|uniref:hypothetical protein n=1 Tax=Spiroplasma citri TaxID=2133 RepID=UPI001C126D3E|nr:hypothetical protein [Spiroplasma citri]